MIKMVIFDLDGTLVNTLGGIANACNYVLAKHGYETKPIGAYMDMVGNGLAMTIFRALPDNKKEELIIKSGLGHHIQDKNDDPTIKNHLDLKHLEGEPDFKIPELRELILELLDYYKDHPTSDSHLYEGVEDVLSYLDDKGILWAIHTNKTASIAKEVADEFIDPNRYVGLKGPNKEVPRKPNPKGSLDLIKEAKLINKEEVLFIGDTEVDIETAKELGVPVIAVTYGFRKEAFLKDLKPDYMIKKPLEIIELIKQFNTGVV